MIKKLNDGSTLIGSFDEKMVAELNGEKTESEKTWEILESANVEVEEKSKTTRKGRKK